VLISNFHSHAIFDSLKLRDVMPLFNLLFFAIIGASVRIESFSADTFVLVLGYVVLRSIAKLGGNWMGCKITGQDPKITASLPKLMLPQAGMAAVETILVAKALADSGGMIVFNTIVPAIVIFELSGAYLSERTLLKWKSWITGEQEVLSEPEAAEAGLSMQNLVGDRAVHMVAKTKDDAMFELVRTLAERGFVEDTSRLLSSIREREQLASTAAGNGVAFPHCRSASVDRPIAICGISDDPIDWGGRDGKDDAAVDMVFLIISPAEDPEQHLTALKTISVALKQDDVRDGLRNALEKDDVPGYVKHLDELAAQPA
jgi:mannitol/fructose-specific phosphotransferase system IIA component (Ntr-type)